MVKSIAVFLFIVGAVTNNRPGGGRRQILSSDPGPGGGPIRLPASVRFRTTARSADTGVTISVYALNGGFTTCGPSTIPARTGTFCHVSIALGTMCGCVVTGEGGMTFASLSVTDPETGAAQATTECR